jgi:DNA invertase Pin-like site-specific DNA recombinase
MDDGTTPVPPARRRQSARTRKREQAATTVVGYLRCSTDEQELDAQRATVVAACAAQGWTVAHWAEDEGVSGSMPPTDRPGFARALALLDSGQAGALVAAKVDRLSRDARHLLALRDRAHRDGWRLVALDLSLDTGTPTGDLMFGLLAVVAEFERERIRERTREALAAKKAAGVRLGRPTVPNPARHRVRELLHDGRTFVAIAALLNAEGYRTATGLAWRPLHVQKLRDSLALDDLALVPSCASD